MATPDPYPTRPLTERQEHILKAVVDTYIATAHPVGSSAVVARSHLPVSSATVRNEMAILEELGYLRHLHTSGGRVPTDAGYRYYVQHLIDRRSLPSTEARTIRHEFRQAHMELQEWLKLAAAVLASRMHNVGLITVPRPPEVRLHNVQIISIHDAVALVILVLQDGTVLQERMALEEARTQEELSAQADRLNRDLHGLTAREIASRHVPGVDAPLVQVALRLLERAEVRETQLFHTGLADLLRQPEFMMPQHGEPMSVLNERLHHLVEFLQQGVALDRLLSEPAQVGEVQVIFGGDATVHGLEGYSFVLGHYGGGPIGILGVAGPTRMEYPRAIALVRYMTDLMTDLVQG